MARRLALGVVFPLAVGAAVYLLLRPRRAWFTERLLGIGGVGDALRAARAVTVPIGRNVLPRLLDVAPDFAWAFAAGAALAIAWRGRPGRAKIAWCVAGAAVVLGYEIAQRFHWVPGTFDRYDLAAQTAGYAIGWLAHPARKTAKG